MSHLYHSAIKAFASTWTAISKRGLFNILFYLDELDDKYLSILFYLIFASKDLYLFFIVFVLLGRYVSRLHLCTANSLFVQYSIFKCRSSMSESSFWHQKASKLHSLDKCKNYSQFRYFPPNDESPWFYLAEQYYLIKKIRIPFWVPRIIINLLASRYKDVSANQSTLQN